MKKVIMFVVVVCLLQSSVKAGSKRLSDHRKEAQKSCSIKRDDYSNWLTWASYSGIIYQGFRKPCGVQDDSKQMVTPPSTPKPTPPSTPRDCKYSKRPCEVQSKKKVTLVSDGVNMRGSIGARTTDGPAPGNYLAVACRGQDFDNKYRAVPTTLNFGDELL